MVSNIYKSERYFLMETLPGGGAKTRSSFWKLYWAKTLPSVEAELKRYMKEFEGEREFAIVKGKTAPQVKGTLCLHYMTQDEEEPYMGDSQSHLIRIIKKPEGIPVIVADPQAVDWEVAHDLLSKHGRIIIKHPDFDVAKQELEARK